MSRRVRLDAELVRRRLARSREHARELIDAERVKVQGVVARKAATQVTTDQAILLVESTEPTWVSRGAHKLLGALAVFEPAGLDVRDRIVMDAGASTGGFTEVLLSRGVARVFAVDVGYGQLAWSLRTDDRVTVMDRTNVRELTASDFDVPIDLLVSDVSFISLTTVLPAFAKVVASHGDMVLMVKPQFEVGKDNLGKNGVVRDRGLHADAVYRVCQAAHTLNWGTQALAPSPLPGPAGNVEYFCWLKVGAPPPTLQLARDVVEAGPLDTGGESS